MEENVMKNLALKEVDAFSRRYKDLKKDIKHQAKIVALTLGNDIDDIDVYSVEISPKNEKTFVTSSGCLIGGYLIYDKKNRSLEVQEFESINENIATSNVIGYLPFDEIDTDLQVSILKEIVENYM